MKKRLGILSITIVLGLALCACSQLQPTAVVSGAISKHVNDDQKRDEINPLLALEFNNKIQIGMYDNSRLRPSNSLYASYRWLNYKVAKLPVHITSKAGAALYDNQSGYDYSLKPITSLGMRYHFPEKLFIDIDYMPSRFIDKGDVFALTFGYQFGGVK